MIRHPRDCPVPRIPVIGLGMAGRCSSRRPRAITSTIIAWCGPTTASGTFSGITGPQKSDPEKEVRFAHGVGEKLWSDTLFTECNPVCDDGNRAWAPGIARKGPRYVMLYGPSPTKAAVSRDLNHWMGQTISLPGAPPECHRDHMILQLEEEIWLMYCTALDEEGRGVIAVFRFQRPDRMALRPDGLADPGRGRAETGVGRDRVTLRGEDRRLVLPFAHLHRLQEGELSRHPGFPGRSIPSTSAPTTRTGRRNRSCSGCPRTAPELIRDPADGSWYITTCGWNDFGIPHEGAVSIAKLEWREDRG